MNSIQKAFDIKGTVKNNLFTLYYQPKINLKTKKVESCEALIRLKSGGKIISPDNYMDIIPTSKTVIVYSIQKEDSKMFKMLIIIPSLILVNVTAKDLGYLSKNKFAPNSTSNKFAPAGSKYNPDSIHNKYGTYGSKYSNKSVTNPYATNAPKLYDSNGNYRGKLSKNRYDPDSVSNPYGRYGSKYSPESINNPYGAGSKYKTDSPNNPYGTGLKIVGQ
jgi:hypothetical protein